MQDERKTKTQLVHELRTLRTQLKRLEKSDDDAIGGVQIISQDITERKKADVEIAMLAHTIQSIGECVSITDTENKILFVNDSFLRTYGYTADELIGKPITVARSQTAEPGTDEVLHATLQGRWQGELVNRKKDGTEFPIALSTSVVRNEKGQPIALVGIAVDITERKRADEALRKSAVNLAGSQRIGKLGCWDWDIAENSLSWSDETHRIWGVGKDFPLTFENIVGMIHPDDREVNSKMIQEFLATRDEGKYEFRIICPDGTAKCICQSVEVTRAPSGQPIRMFGIMQDITERKQAEKVQRENEANLTSLVENTEDRIWAVDADYRLIISNAQFTKGVEEGLKRKIALGESVLPESLPQAVQAEWRGYYDRALRGESFKVEMVTRFSGKADYGDYRFYPIRLADGKINGVVVSGRDITERKRAEQLIEDERNLLGSIINAIPDEIVVKDPERKFVLANEGCLRALGKNTMDEVVGLRDEDLVPEPFVRDAREKEIHVLTSGETLLNDMPEPRRNPNTGELERVIMSTKTPLRDRSGSTIGLVTVNRNVTELQVSLEALSQSEKRFRTVWDHALDAMRLTDAEGTIVLVNQSYCQLFKKGSEELVGRSLAESYLRKPDENIVGDYCERFRTRTIAPFQEEEVRLWNAEELCVEISNASLPVPNQPELLLSIFRDVTGRKRAEEALSASEARYRGIIEQSLDGIMVSDGQGKIATWNKSLESITGVPECDAIGRPLWEIQSQLIPVGQATPELLGQLRTGLKNVIASNIDWPGETREQTIRCADGTSKIVQDSTFIVRTGTVVNVAAIIRDITERKRVEEALRVSLEKYRVLFESFPLGITISDKSGKIIEANRRSEQLLGITLDAHTKKSIDGKEWQILRKDGTPMPVDEFASTRALQEDRLIENVEMGIVKDKGVTTWINVTAAPIPLEGFGVAIAYGDITDRKLGEEHLQRSQEQLHLLAGHLQSVREEERKHLAQEFHDQLGQTLTAIKMDLSMLHRAIADPGKESSRSVIAQGIESSQDMIDRAIAIIREILSELRPELLDQLGIVPTLEWEVERFQRKSGIACTFHSTVGTITLDAKTSIALYRIFQEALTNVARHAKAIRVDVALRKESDVLLLEIKDNGIGIPAIVLERSQSFGLIGMRERAILLGGTLEIGGGEGQGTTVRARIPVEQTRANGGAAI